MIKLLSAQQSINIQSKKMSKNLNQNANEKAPEPMNGHFHNNSIKQGKITIKKMSKGHKRNVIFIQVPSNMLFQSKQLAKFYQRFEGQFDFQASISSPYVIKNFDIRLQSRKIIIIQEFYSDTLSEFVLKSLTLQKRLKIFYELAKGIKDLHDHLICHRALKPQHICLIQNGEEFLVKINNFESAQKLDCPKSSISYAPASMDFLNKENNEFSSPELWLGRKHGLATDIWSLGAILNYLLYETMKNVWEEEEEIKVEVPKGTPLWLSELLKSMMYYNPQKRYSPKIILEIIKVSMKCTDVMGKFIPIGRKSFKSQKMQSKLSKEPQD